MNKEYTMLDRNKFDRIIGFLSGLEGCIANKGNRSVLVCGRSGAGVSTFINYAGGIKFEQCPHAYGTRREISDASLALTSYSHETISETNHPIVVNLNNNVKFIDLPALDNNNDYSHSRYVGYMSILFATAFSGNVVGIVMGIELSKIENPRDNGGNLKNYPHCILIDHLIHLIPTNVLLSEKLFFVGLKNDRLLDEFRDDDIKHFQGFFVETYEWFLRKSKKSFDRKNELSKCHAEKIDVTDNGQSREKILAHFQHLTTTNLMLNLPTKERIEFESDFKAFLSAACSELHNENIGEKLFMITYKVCEIMSPGAQLASLDSMLENQIMEYMRIYDEIKSSATVKLMRASQSSSGIIIESDSQLNQNLRK
jgi:hypothetical protein